MTIGHTVTWGRGYAPTDGNIEHEFTHVLQYEILGGVGFGVEYFKEWAVLSLMSDPSPYEHMPLEVWAYREQKDTTTQPGMSPWGAWSEAAG